MIHSDPSTAPRVPGPHQSGASPRASISDFRRLHHASQHWDRPGARSLARVQKTFIGMQLCILCFSLNTLLTFLHDCRFRIWLLVLDNRYLGNGERGIRMGRTSSRDLCKGTVMISLENIVLLYVIHFLPIKIPLISPLRTIE